MYPDYQNQRDLRGFYNHRKRTTYYEIVFLETKMSYWQFKNVLAKIRKKEIEDNIWEISSNVVQK